MSFYKWKQYIEKFCDLANDLKAWKNTKNLKAIKTWKLKSTCLDFFLGQWWVIESFWPWVLHHL